MVDIIDILENKYSNNDLAFALSQKEILFNKENIKINIEEGSLLISSPVTIGIFTSIESLYNKIYDTMIVCHGAFEDTIGELDRCIAT